MFEDKCRSILERSTVISTLGEKIELEVVLKLLGVGNLQGSSEGSPRDETRNNKRERYGYERQLVRPRWCMGDLTADATQQC